MRAQLRKLQASPCLCAPLSTAPVSPLISQIPKPICNLCNFPYHWQWTEVMSAARDSDNYHDAEIADRPEWAGLPIEYWIDLNVLEESAVFEILEELCQKF